jgi:hypothetical protein
MFPSRCPARRAGPGARPGMLGAAGGGRAVPEPPAITVTADGAPVSGAGARARAAPQALAVHAVPGRGVPAVPRGTGVHGARQVAGARTMHVAAHVRAVIRAAGRGAGTMRGLRSRKLGLHGAAGHGGMRTPTPGQTRRRREMKDAQDPGGARDQAGARDQMGVLACGGEAAPGLRPAGEQAVAGGLWLAGERGLAAAPGQRGSRQVAPARDPGYGQKIVPAERVRVFRPGERPVCRRAPHAGRRGVPGGRPPGPAQRPVCRRAPHAGRQGGQHSGRKATRGRRHAGVRDPGLAAPGVSGRVGTPP